MLFIPKKSKFKKRQKGKKLNTINKVCTINKLNFGRLGLKAMNCGHMTSKQLSSLRQTINKVIKKKGKLKINIFPNTPITKKPLEVRMGKGKGNIDRWVFKVRSGTILCEIETTSLITGLQALKLAQFKIPIRTKIISNE
jgi:large subunit ribosomal protein L16